MISFDYNFDRSHTPVSELKPQSRFFSIFRQNIPNFPQQSTVLLCLRAKLSGQTSAQWETHTACADFGSWGGAAAASQAGTRNLRNDSFSPSSGVYHSLLLSSNLQVLMSRFKLSFDFLGKKKKYRLASVTEVLFVKLLEHRDKTNLWLSRSGGGWLTLDH